MKWLWLIPAVVALNAVQSWIGRAFACRRSRRVGSFQRYAVQSCWGS
jgi:hypothetical protein